MIRVFIADDQELVRSGLAMIIGSEDDLTVVGHASNGSDAVHSLPAARPDVVLMDIEMPTMNGLEATRRISNQPDAPPVIILTTFDRDDYVFEALSAGAAGFLLKNTAGQQLIDAIRLIANGAGLLAPEITRRVIARFAGAHPEAHASRVIASLTPRELSVLELVADGLNNQEIAHRLYVSEATIKTHVSSIFLKLGCRDRVQAAILAVKAGLGHL